MSGITRLFSDTKNFLANEVNRLFVLVLCLSLVFGVVIVTNNNKVEKKLNKIEKKVDFRYFNLTRSLADIHNIEIDTKDGRIRN